MGKSGNQIQMLVNISATPHTLDMLCQFCQIHFSADCLNRKQVRRLHADLKLNQARTKSAKKFKILFPQKISPDLKVKIRHSVIVFFDVFPYFVSMLVIAVKGTIDKFYLFHTVFQEKVQFVKYQIQRPQAHRFVDRRQTVAAGKWAATDRFIINDAVFHLLQVAVGKYEIVHFHRHTRCRKYSFPVFFPVTEAGDIRTFFRPFPQQKCHIFAEGILAFSDHDKIHKRISLKYLLRIVRNFRSSQDNFHLRANFLQIFSHIKHILNIPDIARKSDNIRFFSINSGKNFLFLVIDGIFCQFNVLFVFSGVRFQRIHRQIGMDIFGIDRC